MTVSPATDQALRAAMERLTAGTPQRCDGELTVSNLAREAGVSRATANRASGIVAELHRRRSTPDDLAEDDRPAETLRQRIRRLESELASAKRAVRAEDDELRHRGALLAQQVQALTIENHRLREHLDTRTNVRNIPSPDHRRS